MNASNITRRYLRWHLIDAAVTSAIITIVLGAMAAIHAVAWWLV